MPTSWLSISLQQKTLQTTYKGRLKQEWRDLFERYPDRFLFGLDLGPPGRLEELKRLVSYYRSILGQLKRETAERIGHLNARRILGAAADAGRQPGVSG